MKKLAALACVLTVGCGYGKLACSVVDVAEEGCKVVRYMTPEGQTKEICLSHAQLRQMAHQEALAREARNHPDAGP